MNTVSLNPKYIPLFQKPFCCAVTCLQMILYRNGYGLFDQEELAKYFEVHIDDEWATAFNIDLPRLTKANFDEGISTVESEDKINTFFAENKIQLKAQAYKYSAIDSVSIFLEENLKKNHDIWIEYHTHETHKNTGGEYIHDGLVEEVDFDTNMATVINPTPKEKQRLTIDLDILERAISTEFGKETGFVVVSKL